MTLVISDTDQDKVVLAIAAITTIPDLREPVLNTESEQPSLQPSVKFISWEYVKFPYRKLGGGRIAFFCTFGQFFPCSSFE